MRRCYYEDARRPWEPDGILRRFLSKKKKQIPRPDKVGARNDKRRPSYAKASGGKALDIGMGYGRNAIWLAQRGYEVEGWERDRRYLAEARRRAALLRPRGYGGRALLRQGFGGQGRLRRDARAPVRLRVKFRGVDFTRARMRGRYDVIVISLALHQVRRSAALRVLRRACEALAPGGRLFLLVKLTRDRLFQRARRDWAWKPVPGERNTFFRPPRRGRGYFHPGRPRPPRMILSTLTPEEVRRALRGLKLRTYREVVLRSDWEEEEPVTHTVAEVVAQRQRN